MAPAGASGTLTVTVQSSGLSLLKPRLTVYAADQATVLGTATGTNWTGNTLSLTLPGVAAGQQVYVKVNGADATAFSTGRYALTLNFGTGPAPTVPLPNTMTPNGNPISGGGGQALVSDDADHDHDHNDGCCCPNCGGRGSDRPDPTLVSALSHNLKSPLPVAAVEPASSVQDPVPGPSNRWTPPAVAVHEDEDSAEWLGAGEEQHKACDACFADELWRADLGIISV